MLKILIIMLCNLTCQTVCVGVENKLSGHYYDHCQNVGQSQSDFFADSMMKQILIIQILSVIKN